MRLHPILAVALATTLACGSSGKSDTTPVGPGHGAGATGPAGHPAEGLIPRAILFGNPDRAGVQISPDGKQLSWLAPEGDVMNIWVAPRAALDQARVITADKTRPVRSYQWAFDNQHILYAQDTGGDEDWHIHSVEVATGKDVDLTPMKKIAGQIVAVSHRHPGTVLLGINDRNPQLHDIYKADLATGKLDKLVENPGFVGFGFDDDLRVRTATAMTPDGGLEIKVPGKQAGEWVSFQKIPGDDMLTTNAVGFDKSGKTQYMFDSRGRDTAALVALDMKTGKSKLLAEHARADASGLMVHPTENTVQAVSFTFERNEWKVLDPKVAPDLDKLRALGGEVAVSGRTLDDQTWVVVAYADNGPVRYFLWDRKAQKEQFLFSNRKALEGVELARMNPVVIKARDGLDLVSYLSLPHGSDKDADGKPDAALPMVLLVHGGPWARDDWGFDPLHQLLTNRGYAVLSVNFRGSTGFGKGFINAANREWAGKMHDDLLDAVTWAVDQGVAQKDKVAIMGGSYGGYATLVGLTFTPDVFACGVDIVGPSSIITLLSTIPPYWQPMIDLFKTRVGDHTTSEGKAFLRERSPLSKVAAIQRPLLIGQGANDPRVKQAEADQIVKAMQAKQIPVTYVLFPDEGHGFARPENSLAFWAVTEAFLSAHLGGSYQPYDGKSFAGSSITVPTGAAAVPGLAAAIGK